MYIFWLFIHNYRLSKFNEHYKYCTLHEIFSSGKKSSLFVKFMIYKGERQWKDINKIMNCDTIKWKAYYRVY